MKYGYFDDARKEYVITSPKTPLPWINYLGSEDFFSLISNTCGGYSFYKDAKLLRLTRYRYNNVPYDSNGHYYYIKENDTIWNPGWMPTKTDLDSYECHHGMGYSTFRSTKNQLQAELTAFVPVGRSCEINELTLTNKSVTSPPERLRSTDLQSITKQSTVNAGITTHYMQSMLQLKDLIQIASLSSAHMVRTPLRKLS